MSDEKKIIKRFYKEAAITPCEGGFEIHLDGRAVRTKGLKPLLAPSKALAQAISDEWAAQGEEIDLAANPLSNLLGEAIDGDAADQWREDILAYLNSDLICYRADEPAALVERQARDWGPFVDWFAEEFGVRINVTSGIISVAQPQEASSAVGAVLEGASAALLAGLRKATAITGSAVMALALWRGAFAGDAIFAASLSDENFQAEKWGEDEEAAERRAIIAAEFAHVARFVALLGEG